MDPQSRTMDEVCPGSTSAIHGDTIPDEASARPEPTKEAPKPKASLARARSCPPSYRTSQSSGRGMDPPYKVVDEECPGPTLLPWELEEPIGGASSFGIDTQTVVEVCPSPTSTVDRNTPHRLFPRANLAPELPGPIYPSREMPSTDGYQTDEVWTNEVMNDFNSAQPMDHPRRPCTIFKVPKHIRELDPEAYQPVFAYLGPFHHNWRNSSMEDHKWRCVWHLLSRHRSREQVSQLLNECLSDLKKQDRKVRSCYSEDFSRLSPQDMALIMLLDGCFIIYLMLNIEEKVEQLEGPTVAGLFTTILMVYDLLKLENQIPFFIIQLLFDLLKPCEDGQINLVNLACGLFKGILPEESESFKKSENKSPGEYHHLLHLFYSSRIPSEKPAVSTSAPGEAAPSQGASTSAPTSTSASGCILELMKCKCKKAEVDPSRRSPTSAPKWIPSATELDRAGVKFERKEQTDSFLNINFQRREMKITPLLCLRKLYLMFRSGRMEIPQLPIYDYTGPLFRNLIAFEQCYFDTEMYITIYALFMDCIIDQAEDVRLLHLKGILEHKLSNDQEVADLFNQLGSQIHYVWEKNYLANQIEEVNSFYEVKWHKWLAALRRDYLGNPWATISVLAAIFLLLLTVEQAVFSALSYFHPLHQG